MTESKHEYRDPEGNLLVSIGDPLTMTTVEMLARAHAVRMPTDAELQAEFDQAQATLPTTTAVVEPFVEPDVPDTDELVAMIETAQQQIAEGTETLRRVCDLTDDLQRGAVMVAHLEALVGSGGWCALERETLDGWVKELTTGEEV